MVAKMKILKIFPVFSDDLNELGRCLQDHATYEIHKL